MLSFFLLCSLWGITSASLVNTSIGAIFVPQTPVVLRTTDVKTWLFIPFPEGVTINKTQVQDIFEGHWSEMDEIWSKYSTSKYFWGSAHSPPDHLSQSISRLCGDYKLTAGWIDAQRKMMQALEHQMTLTNEVRQRLIERAQMMVNSTEPVWSRQPKFWAPVVAGAAVATVLEPALREEGCKILSVFGLCKDHKAKMIEELHSALGANKENLKQLSEISRDAIFALESRVEATKENLRLLSTESDTNFAQIRSEMSRMLDWQRELVKWKNDCQKGGFAHSFRTVLEWANGTNYLTGLINEVSSYRMGLLTYEREMSDALEVLIHGRLPVSMVPPDDLATILNQIEKNKLREAIPREFLMSYYSFELVNSVHATGRGLHIEWRVPLHPLTDGLHATYRAIATLRPIENTTTGSRFKLKKTILLVSQQKTTYAEADDLDIIHHCDGNSKLKLCQRSFATTSRPQTGCLSSLFTGMEGHVLEQCEQKVETLPTQPRTVSLGLSTFLVEAPNNAYTWINISSVSGHRSIIPGCISCVIRPPCSGYLEHPNGIQLVPSGDDCEVEDPGDVKEVVQPGLWRDVLGLIAEIAPRDDDGIQSQSILDEVTSELLGAPRGGNLSEKLRTVATPIIQRWAKDTPPKSANTHGQQVTWMVGSIVLFCCFLLSITIIVFGLVWWNPRGQHQQPQTEPPGALAPPPSPGPDDQLSDVEPRNPNTSRFSPA